MKLKYRRILYLSFITTFLIITPLVILYTAGYGYNFKRGRIEKTGILYVDSKPTGANIFINGQLSGKTPKRFTKMLPDKYQLEVKKDGYRPWNKEIEIRSNLTEFAEDIILFKDALPINIIEGEINFFMASPDQRHIIYSVTKSNIEELKIYNIKSKTSETLKKIQNNVEIKFVSWSMLQNLAIFKESEKNIDNYYIVNVTTKEIKYLNEITTQKFIFLDWGLDKDVYLYGLTTTGLFQIDLTNKNIEKVITGKISSFIFNGNTLFYISRENGFDYLNRKIFGIQEQNIVNETNKIKLPPGSNLILQKSRNGYITLLDQLSRDLFILTENVFENEKIENSIILQEKANDLVWSKDNNQILYYNDFEIWTFNILNQQKNLLTRFSELIEMVNWYYGDKYILYLVGNKIKAIETGPTKIKNDILLAELSEINNFTLENQGQNLYFQAQAGNLKGIFSLSLQ